MTHYLWFCFGGEVQEIQVSAEMARKVDNKCHHATEVPNANLRRSQMVEFTDMSGEEYKLRATGYCGMTRNPNEEP